MTIAAVDPWCAYEGSGNRGPFSFQDGSVSIPFAAKAHVTVQRVSSAGVATTLTEGVHYSWSTFVQDATTRLYTGAVTIDAGEAVLAAGEKIVIFRARALDQTYEQAYNSRFDTAALNRQMDRIFAQVQEVKREAGRAIKLPKWEQGPSDLANATQRASKWVGFDSSGALRLGVPSEAATYVDWGEFTSTASQSTFTIYSNSVVDEALLTIDIGGTMQGPGDYTTTLSGVDTMVTFTTPLSAGQSVLWRVAGKLTTTDVAVSPALLPLLGIPGLRVVASKAELKSLSLADVENISAISVLGGTSIGDGYQGVFEVLSGSKTTNGYTLANRWKDDNEAIIVGNNAGNVTFVRRWDGGIQGSWFGIKADGSTNDAPAMKAAFLYCMYRGGGEIELGEGTIRWSSYQEFAYLRNGSESGSETGYGGAGDGINQATSSGINSVDLKGGVRFIGRGSGSGDYFITPDGATIIEFNVDPGPALRFISLFSMTFTDIAFRNIAHLEGASDKMVLHASSYDGGEGGGYTRTVESATHLLFERCVFLEDSQEASSSTTGIADCFIAVDNTKYCTFVDCRILKMGTFARLGTRTLTPDALALGYAGNVEFVRSTIGGHVVYDRVLNLTFNSCEWWPIDAYTTEAAGSYDYPSRIYPLSDSLSVADSVAFIACKADDNKTPSGSIWFKQSAVGGVVTVVGGTYRNGLTQFDMAGDGDLILIGPTFMNYSSASTTDIRLRSTFTGKLVDFSNYEATRAAGKTHLLDERSKAAGYVLASPSAPTSGKFASISAVADNGSGKMRYTSASHGMTTGWRGFIQGVTGGSYTGSRVITVINANTFDVEADTYVATPTLSSASFTTSPISADTTFVTVASATIYPDGGVYDFMYALTLSNVTSAVDNIRLMVRMSIGGVVVPGSAGSISIDSQETRTCAIGPVPYRPAAAPAGATLVLEVAQHTSAAASPCILRNGSAATSDFGSTFVAARRSTTH